MNGRSRNEEISPQLLDLIPKDRVWHMNEDEGGIHNKSSEERKLELRLGPPGEDYSMNNTIKNFNTEREKESLLSLRYFSNNGCRSQKLSGSESPSGSILLSSWSSSNTGYNGKASSFLQFQCSPRSLPVMKEGSEACVSNLVDLQNAEKKAYSPPSAAAKTAVPNSSQKRTAPGPVVGWPPIRSFRKNLASSSSSKPPSESQPQDVVQDKVAGKKPVDYSTNKGLFVKINMDGVPIGRKVDLNAYDSYEKLSSSVDELFRGLLAAQKDSSAGGIQSKQEEEKAIAGLLDGSGEYTLVYEDNEGDRMLVGDVPWHMFVSTVKRLRVLKSSELSAFTLASKQGKIPST